jgi:hypothetical protein
MSGLPARSRPKGLCHYLRLSPIAFSTLSQYRLSSAASGRLCPAECNQLRAKSALASAHRVVVELRVAQRRAAATKCHRCDSRGTPISSENPAIHWHDDWHRT